VVPLAATMRKRGGAGSGIDSSAVTLTLERERLGKDVPLECVNLGERLLFDDEPSMLSWRRWCCNTYSWSSENRRVES
jgi:hypothetical protein